MKKDTAVVIHGKDGVDLTIRISQFDDRQFSTREVMDAVISARNESGKKEVEKSK